jgi:hypothetical protein
MSGSTGESEILTVEPYAGDFYGNYLLSGAKGPEESKELLLKTFPDSFKGSRNIDNGEDVIENLLTLPKNCIVIWLGHGSYSGDEIGPALLLNTKEIDLDWIHKYENRLKNGELYLGPKRNQVYINHCFFDSLKDDTFKNSLFFLGTCSSFADNRLYDSIINKGAAAVLGFDGVVRTNYNFSIMYSFFKGLTQSGDNKYYTLKQAAEFALNECGIVDDNYFAKEFGYSGQLRIKYATEDISNMPLPQILSNQKEKSGETSTSVQSAMSKYSVLVDAKLEADSIEYFDTSMNYNFCVIGKNGKYGLIDYEGNMILPMKYTSIDVSETSPAGKTIKLMAWDDNQTQYWVEEDASLTKTFLGGWGFEEYAEVFWWNEPVMFDDIEGRVDFSYERYSTYNHTTNIMGTITKGTPVVIPVQEINGCQTQTEYGMTKYSVNKVSERYGLLNMKTKKMLTGFVFDDYSYSGIVNGVLAVKKDGKWGYVNEEGKMLTEFIYDASKVVPENNEHMYSALNGYLIVRQGDFWGLLDTEGRVVLETKYQGVSQVNKEGKVWAKENGTWKLLHIDN